MNDLYLEKFKQKYSVDDILGYLDRIKNLKILTVGETIIDKYQYGYTLGKSGKAPIVAFQNENLESYDGGILAINNHIKDFVEFVDISTSKTAIIKKRYIQNGQKLFETYSTTELSSNNLLKNLDNIENYDIVIIADFGHGMMTKDIRDKIMERANFIALNCQMNAGNMGLNTINKYEKATYICVSENELRLALSNQFDALEEIIEENIKNDIVLSVTRGKNGSIIYKNGEFEYIPVLIDKIVDSTGAGDAFLAITSLLVCMKMPLDVIGFIGNCVGALTCMYEGNKKYLTKKGLCEYIKNILK